MKNMGIVRGSPESAIPFEVGVDTVYLRFNIEPVPQQEGDEGETGEQFQYHEIQYDLREWLQIVTEATIDINSFKLADNLVKELSADSGGIMGIAQAYIGLPEQKPFTFAARFAQRRT